MGKLIQGVNDLETTRPDLALQWDYELNREITPRDVTHGQNMVVYWKCKIGHSWKAQINNRGGCPVCAGIKLLTGYNDLETKNPELAVEFDEEKNGISARDVLQGGRKKYWWRCKLGHSWYATLSSRNNGRGCPICANRKLLVGYNDLKTYCHKIAGEFDISKNNMDPSEVLKGSSKKVWWKCYRGHSWEASVSRRTSIGSGCPYCSGLYVEEGYNDLKTLNKNLASEWDYEKNYPLRPEQVTSRSKKKVNWQCKQGHRWKAEISSRARGNGCRICNSGRSTSYPEQFIYHCIKSVFPEALNRYKIEGNKEFDIFIPEIDIAVEYDGYYFHKIIDYTEKDKEKDIIAKQKGIQLYSIKENPEVDSVEYKNKIITYSGRNTTDKLLVEVINMLVQVINEEYKINKTVVICENIHEKIMSELTIVPTGGSLLERKPDICVEWHPTKNGNLTPGYVSFASKKKIYWTCKECKHTWRAHVYSRYNGSGCPVCSGKEIKQGYNDLATTNPEIALEWDYIKNEELTPKHVTRGSGKKVWWVCKEGHEWLANIHSRSKGYGCPVCANQKILTGYNDILTKRPDFAKDWNYIKNGKLLPTNVGVGSGKKIWWICSICGFEYYASVNSRVHGTGCKKCKNMG